MRWLFAFGPRLPSQPLAPSALAHQQTSKREPHLLNSLQKHPGTSHYVWPEAAAYIATPQKLLLLSMSLHLFLEQAANSPADVGVADTMRFQADLHYITHSGITRNMHLQTSLIAFIAFWTVGKMLLKIESIQLNPLHRYSRLRCDSSTAADWLSTHMRCQIFGLWSQEDYEYLPPVVRKRE